MLRRVLFGLFGAAILAQPARGQSAEQPYTLDQVLALVRGGVASTAILSDVRGVCIGFKLTSGNSSVLVEAGADETLIVGLRSACYRAPKSDNHKDHPIPARVVVKHDTVVVQRPTHDTVVVYRPVKIDSAANALKVYFDWDSQAMARIASSSNADCLYRAVPTGHVVVLIGERACGVLTPEVPNPVRIEIIGSVASGNPQWGVTFGSFAGTKYVFAILDNSYSLIRIGNGFWQVLVKPVEFAVNSGQGAINRLAVDVRGRDIDMYINGQRVSSYIADSAVTGKAGVYVTAGDKGSSVLFSGIRAVELK